MPGFWRRHRVAAVALALSALLTLFSVASDALQVGRDPGGLTLDALVSMAIGFRSCGAS